MTQLETMQNTEVIDTSVSFSSAPVLFVGYEEIKAQAQMVADYINSVEVTPENIQDVKKDLASARKITTELDTRRKAIKKEILHDYTIFEEQIKEIKAIVDDADSVLRDKVRVLEEADRQKKKEQIREIWDKRFGQYELAQYGQYFDVWLRPVHLNKTASMKSIEADMVEWLESHEKDMDTLSGMDDEYLVEYLGCLDLAEAIQNVNFRNEIRSSLNTEDPDEDKATFIIIGKKNIKLAEMLLTENEIEFTRR